MKKTLIVGIIACLLLSCCFVTFADDYGENGVFQEAVGTYEGVFSDAVVVPSYGGNYTSQKLYLDTKYLVKYDLATGEIKSAELNGHKFNSPGLNHIQWDAGRTKVSGVSNTRCDVVIDGNKIIFDYGLSVQVLYIDDDTKQEQPKTYYFDMGTQEVQVNTKKLVKN